MMRFCPSCETERPISELVCEGLIGGRACEWDLAGLPLRAEGWRPAPPVVAAAAPETAACTNGHPMAPGDLLCPVCGADVGGPAVDPEGPEVEATEIAGWRLERALSATGEAEARYIAARDGREAVLTLYAQGREPDAEVYDVLRSLSRDHVPEILETGRWEDRAFEVSEDLKGGTLADLGLFSNDTATLSQVLFEVGKALGALAECGLRHRDLRPGAILVRDREPLDLVVTGFGSARLSEFDLDIVSPLETTRYTAPEALAGGVAAASDWWSLGMVLLEQVTQGACFEGVNDQAFLIHILTNGAPIPEDIDPSVGLLLRGLLARDRHERSLAVNAMRKAEMTSFFGAGSFAEVAVKIQGIERKAELEGQIDAAHRDILEAVRAPNLAEAEQTLEAAERTVLEAEFAELEARFNDEDQRARDLFAAQSKAADMLDAVGGDDVVAKLEEQRRTTALEIEDGALRYLRLRIGAAAADRALRAFRDQHRSAMMTRASDAFHTISRGAYKGLTTQADKENEILIAQGSDGGSKIASELSKGTRFQLYLALRVAGYHEFVRTRRPLPFVADDIMETFDDFRAEEAFRLFMGMAEVGQVIYLTHHRHLCEIARHICPSVRIHSLG